MNILKIVGEHVKAQENEKNKDFIKRKADIDIKHSKHKEAYANLDAEKKAKAGTQNQYVLSKLAKQANDRMRDLEKAHASKTEGAKESPAYIQAKKWLAENTEGRVKFAQRTKTMNPQQTAAEIKRVKQFLSAATSTATKHEKVVAAANQRLFDRGVAEKDLEIAKTFLRSQLYHKLMSKLPSDQIMDMLTDKKFKYLLKYEAEAQMSEWVISKTNKLLGGKYLTAPKKQDELFNEQATVQDDATGTKKKREEEPPMFGK